MREIRLTFSASHFMRSSTTSRPGQRAETDRYNNVGSGSGSGGGDDGGSASGIGCAIYKKKY